MRPGLNRAATGPADTRFGRWLNAPDRGPVAVALSGGGDSLALLHLAKAWADAAGRPLVALTVDHGLQAASAAWTRFAAAAAAKLGVAHHTLAWAGPKPQAGLPAAARTARHALLAEAARAGGARVVLMGHTADDLIEAALMREAGVSTPSPRVWSPSPAWPQGRGVFLLRPLLDMRRAELRAMLRRQDETWIDDPANDDPRFSRALARRSAGDRVPPSPEASTPTSRWLGDVREDPGGGLALPRSSLRRAAPDEAARLVGALTLCAAGTSRPPAGAALGRLVARLTSDNRRVVSSLAGARIEADGDDAMFRREAGEQARGGLAGYEAPVGESVFDGRWLVRADEPGWRVEPLRGRAARLSSEARRRLRALAPAVRAALPVAVSPAGELACPTLPGSGPLCASSLGGARLAATLGAVPDEATLWRVAKTDAGS